jgi:alkanesulfonate monooxygenase SsuD/methylene tetrahydromethanopterin reductase-like flavin-dependent oxidoreductase (luciferase family)
VSVETAAWASEWADGLITINQPHEHLGRMLDAFDGPAAIQVHLSWAPSEEEALRIAHDQWRTNVFSPPLCWDLATVEQFDEAAKHVRPEALRGAVQVSSDLGQHVQWISELADLGFDAIYLHHVGKEQRAFIEAFGEHVLPRL